MFAGSDFLLMPSRFEPCGLSQMYAQKFGALPIATAQAALPTQSRTAKPASFLRRRQPTTSTALSGGRLTPTHRTVGLPPCAGPRWPAASAGRCRRAATMMSIVWQTQAKLPATLRIGYQSNLSVARRGFADRDSAIVRRTAHCSVRRGQPARHRTWRARRSIQHSWHTLRLRAAAAAGERPRRVAG